MPGPGRLLSCRPEPRMGYSKTQRVRDHLDHEAKQVRCAEVLLVDAARLEWRLHSAIPALHENHHAVSAFESSKLACGGMMRRTSL